MGWMVQSETLSDASDACLVVAHPDDEVLWFSSVLNRVERIVVCFEDCDELPELGTGRRAVRRDYPLGHVDWLCEPEPCTVNAVDWSSVEFGPFGCKLDAASQEVQSRYAQSYRALLAKLKPLLSGMQTVFTHNPWGEYGHPDHVQVCRVIESLRAELGFRVLYSGYVSSRTMRLATLELPLMSSAFSLPTNAALAESLVQLYVEHDCWTWPRDYTRFSSETFLEKMGASPRAGWGYSLNCVTA
jgi:hypothetical protein